MSEGNIRWQDWGNRRLGLVLGLCLVTALATGCGTKGQTMGSGTSPQGGESTDGGGSPGSLSASSSALNFGSVPVGSNKSMPLTLTNSESSAANVKISQIKVSGTGFNIGGATLPATLAAGQSLALSVTFAPSSGGSTSGDLSIASTASDPTITVALSGSGLAPGQVAVAPAAMNFGNVTVGQSRSQTGTLTAGGSSVTVSSATWNGSGFSLSGITFPLTIPAGQSASFTVTFSPPAAASDSGSVSFLSNASDSTITEQLSGTGLQTVSHSVALNWNPDAVSVQGYNVYRGSQTGGPYARVTANLDGNTSFTDSGVKAGQTYYYVVTAVASNGLESAYSNEVQALIPTP